MKKFLLLILLTVSITMTSCTCGRRSERTRRIPSGQPEVTVFDTSVIEQSQKKEANVKYVNFYIENSGSMNAYVNQSSDYQYAIQRLVTLLKNEYGEDCIQFNFITDNIYPVDRRDNENLVRDFVPRVLASNTFKDSKYGTPQAKANSEINKIVETVLGNTNDETISILVSDLIFSINNPNGVVRTQLNSCLVTTQDTFLTKLKNGFNLSTLLIRLTSNYSGRYWEYSHPTSSPINLNCSRPYFMCILGNDANIDDFMAKISISEMPGYANELFLSARDYSDTPYSILTATGNEGRFRKDKKENGMCHTIINAAKQPHSSSFAFSIGVDMSTLPMTAAEKLDVNNYEVIGAQYRIVSVIEKSDLNHVSPTDQKDIDNFRLSHFIKVETDYTPVGAVEIRVKKMLPSWVHDYTSIDDRQIQNDGEEQQRTFGLEFFVKGIQDAFTENGGVEKGVLTTILTQIKR